MRLLRVRQVSAKVGYSPATVWRKTADDPDFPKPIKVTRGVTTWVEEEVDAYLHRLVRQRRGINQRTDGERLVVARKAKAAASKDAEAA